jgi:hypothetical protein
MTANGRNRVRRETGKKQIGGVAEGAAMETIRRQNLAPSTRWDELSKLPFRESYPTSETSARLYDELQFQRACQVYLWALPAMNMVAMRDGQAARFGAGNNVLAIWKDRINAKTIITTANPDVIYGLAFLDLKDGPVVFEAAPQMQGLLNDFWHRPLTDVGLAGPDQGVGGKFLLLPPGYAGAPPDGYYVMKSPTYGVFVFLRAFLVDGKTDAGVELMEQTRIYPLAQKDNPPAMKFPNASATPADYDFKRDLRYFESLAEFINHEAVAPEDMAMRGMAASLGIVKGQPFQPDAKMKATLNAAGDVAFKMAAVDSYDTRYPDKLIYRDRRCWVIPFLGGSVVFRQDSYLDWDAFIYFFHKAYSTSPAMMVAMPGKGSQYLPAYRAPTEITSLAGHPTACTRPPTCPPRITGPWCSMTPTPVRCWTTANRSHPSPPTAISSPTPTVRRTSTSARPRPKSPNRTGSRPFPVAATSSQCAFTLPPRPSSSRLGSPMTS